ncbi:MAG: preprotein translocase subunit SecA [Oleispira sp.]|jgi:preprotein translocase subunit SecA
MFKKSHLGFPLRLPSSLLWRPEQTVQKPRCWYERYVHQVIGWGSRLRWRIKSPLGGHIKATKLLDHELRVLSDDALREAVTQLRQQVLRHGYCWKTLERSFALIREVSGRILGMRHFDNQLQGGFVMFMGRVAEMATGEGKTLTATLPVAAAALAGIPVHIITVNDYLASRDAEEMRPLYEWLGLSVGCIQQGMSTDQRRAIYACDITYCTNKELVFDYLKDHLIIKQATHSTYRHSERLKGNQTFDQQLMLRGLHFAIVDEADSVCMDEARTPLIISGQIQHNQDYETVYLQAMSIAKMLDPDKDYEQNDIQRYLELSITGENKIDILSTDMGSYWVGRVRRYEIVRQALSALIFFERDRHYLVNDGKIQIIDEHTGRVMPDRTWEKGLHQLIETKEDCAITAPREPLAKISYQKFFRRYHCLAGMTGTAKEVVNEFWQIYDIPVVDIPTHQRVCRRFYDDILCKTETDKLEAIVQSVHREITKGRSVLVGTSTVRSSELIAQRLVILGVNHSLLNAKQDAEEASIILSAGQPGNVTIATSMAGRGTDIKLHPKVKKAGGLHVILTELQDASRIDRQLAGRCARFGDPGSVELIVSIEDEWLQRAWYRNTLKFFSHHAWGQRLAIDMMRRSQKRLEKRYSRARYQLLQADESKSKLLAFITGNL